MHRPSAESWTYRHRARTYYEQKGRPQGGLPKVRGDRLRGVERHLVLWSVRHEANAGKAQDHHRPGWGSGTGGGMTTKFQTNVAHPDPQKKSRHRVVVLPTFGQRLAEST